MTAVATLLKPLERATLLEWGIHQQYLWYRFEKVLPRRFSSSFPHLYIEYRYSYSDLPL